MFFHSSTASHLNRRSLNKLSLIFCFFIFALHSIDLLAQSTFEHQVCLRKVSFSEDPSATTEEYIRIRSDKTGKYYIEPQYKQLSCNGGKARKNPIAYVSGSKINAKASFEKMCPEEILIRGMAPKLGTNLPPIYVTCSWRNVCL